MLEIPEVGWESTGGRFPCFAQGARWATALGAGGAAHRPDLGSLSRSHCSCLSGDRRNEEEEAKLLPFIHSKIFPPPHSQENALLNNTLDGSHADGRRKTNMQKLITFQNTNNNEKQFRTTTQH